MPTKYYVGNFTAGKYPNKDVLTKLEEQQSTYKIVDIDGNEPRDIYIDMNTNQICVQWKSINPGTYYIEMNRNMFNTVCIEIIDDPVIEQPAEYIPILLQEA